MRSYRSPRRYRPTARTAAATYVGLGLLSRGSSFLLLPLAALKIPIGDYGKLAVAATVGNFVAVLTGFGLESVTSRLALQHTPVANKDYSDLVCLFVFVAPLAAIAVVAVGVGGQTQLLTVPPSVMAFSCAEGIFIGAATDVVLPFFRARSLLGSFTAVNATTLSVVIVGRLVDLFAFGGNLAGWAACGLAARAVAFPLSLVLLNRHGNGPSQMGLSNLLAGARVWKRGLPLLPHGLSHWGLNLGDRVLLAVFVPFAAVGRYAVAYQFAAMFGFLLTEVNNALIPIYGRLGAGGDLRAGLSLVRRHSSSILLLTPVSAAFVAVAVPLVLPKSYAESLYLVPGLLLGYSCYALSLIPFTILTVAHGKTSDIWRASFSGLLANLIGDLILIPTIGVVGAVIGSALGYAVLAVHATMLESSSDAGILALALLRQRAFWIPLLTVIIALLGLVGVQSLNGHIVGESVLAGCLLVVSLTAERAIRHRA